MGDCLSFNDLDKDNNLFSQELEPKAVGEK